MSQISSAAEQARENARTVGGRFGEQHKSDAGQLGLSDGGREVECRTNGEAQAALDDPGVATVVVNQGRRREQFRLVTDRTDVTVRPVGSTRVSVTGPCRVEAGDRAEVHAHGGAMVDASGEANVSVHDSGSVCARERAQVRAYDEAQVSASGDAVVYASDQVSVSASGRAKAFAGLDASIELRESASGQVSGGASATVFDGTQVEAMGASSVTVHGSARVEAWENARVYVASGDPTVVLSGNAACFR